MRDNSRVDTTQAILPAHPDALLQAIRKACLAAGGWLPFDRFMSLALYSPEGGYYSGGRGQFGHWPADGSDFVTAPELSPWFGRTLGAQVAQALEATSTHEVWEFGAGTGALARQVLAQLDAMGRADVRYHIVDLSGSLRQRQQESLSPWADRVDWPDRLPERFEGVVLGNEVLDAMPVQLLHRIGGVWHERGVRWASDRFEWDDRPTEARPPVGIDGTHDYLTETHAQAEAFLRTLAAHWQQGLAFFIDYGFPEAEYYHPQRAMGTLMCHRAHRSDSEPLHEVGQKDITAHVNFTAMAMAAQEAGLSVAGYCSQGRFLLNAGLLDLAAEAPLAERAALSRLINEHEMGELFKVLVLQAGARPLEHWPTGLLTGDRCHTL